MSSDTESEEKQEEEEEQAEEEEAVKIPRKSTRGRSSTGAKAPRANPGRKRGLSMISSDEEVKSQSEEEEEEEEQKPEPRKRRPTGGKAPQEIKKQRHTSVPDTDPVDAASEPGVCVCVCVCVSVCERSCVRILEGV